MSESAVDEIVARGQRLVDWARRVRVALYNVKASEAKWKRMVAKHRVAIEASGLLKTVSDSWDAVDEIWRPGDDSSRPRAKRFKRERQKRRKQATKRLDGSKLALSSVERWLARHAENVAAAEAKE